MFYPAFFAGFAAMQVPVGLLFDRFGCRLPMTALAICGAAGSAMIATTRSFAQALLGQGLLGIGCAPALMGIYYHYGQVLPWEKAARVATTIVAIGSLGALVSAMPLELLVSTVGWRYAVASSACSGAPLQSISVERSRDHLALNGRRIFFYVMRRRAAAARSAARSRERRRTLREQVDETLP